MNGIIFFDDNGASIMESETNFLCLDNNIKGNFLYFFYSFLSN